MRIRNLHSEGRVLIPSQREVIVSGAMDESVSQKRGPGWISHMRDVHVCILPERVQAVRPVAGNLAERMAALPGIDRLLGPMHPGECPPFVLI